MQNAVSIARQPSMRSTPAREIRKVACVERRGTMGESVGLVEILALGTAVTLAP